MCINGLQGFRACVQGLHSSGVQVLLTSRCRVGIDLEEALHLRINSLRPEHAVELLQSRHDPRYAKAPLAAFGCSLPYSCAQKALLAVMPHRTDLAGSDICTACITMQQSESMFVNV